jgi:hypothetical protein
MLAALVAAIEDDDPTSEVLDVEAIRAIGQRANS